MHFIKFTAKLHFFRERSIMIPLKIVFLHPNKTKDFIKVKILTNSQIKEWDKYTIEKEPISSIDLMERAAQKLTEAIARRWNNQTPIKVFAGPGNNGGDALAVARLLSENLFYVTSGYNKEFFETYENNRYSLTPNFVTVDSMMHTYHLYFSLLLNRISRGLLNLYEHQHLRLHTFYLSSLYLLKSSSS